MELKFDPENPIYVHVTTESQYNEALEDLEKQKVVGVDIEGTSLDPYSSILLTIQVGTPEKSYIFDARALKLAGMPRIKGFLEDPKIIKILHNGKFDYKHIKQNLGISMCNIFDTMLTETILNAGLSSSYYSLKDLAVKYTGVTLQKSVRESFEYMTASTKLNESQLKYGAVDTLILFPIFEEQIKKLKKEQLVDIAKLEYATTRVVGDMELKGVHIDVKRWRQLINDLAKKRDELAKIFQQDIRPLFKSNTVDLFGNIGDSININSQVQLMDLFNNKMHLNLPSTGDGILELCDNPTVKILREYRGYEKLVSAFGENLLSKINPITKRIHPDFNQLGAATGRFSCNNPNFQQIPRQSENAPFRSCFNPEPGYKLVTTDYSTFEMRIMAELSGDANLVDAFKRGVDVHSHTAALMFGLEMTDDFAKKYPNERFAAKSINFGLMYGRGPTSLAKQLGISPERGREYLDKYFKSYPGVQKYLDRVSKEAVKKGWSTTPAGRKRWYAQPDPTDPDYTRKISHIQRQAKNHPIQGTNADAIKYALVFLTEKIKEKNIDASIVLTVHDEVVCEVREDQAEEWSVIQSNEMMRAGQLFIKKVPVESKPFVSDVWEH
ncbi:MAG TPA: DNA polymerase [bacterium]|nr:DNA polymerase [bacterium]